MAYNCRSYVLSMAWTAFCAVGIFTKAAYVSVPSDLDTSFNSDANSFIYILPVQADGKMLIGLLK